MTRRKRKLTKAEKLAKKQRREQYEWIFVNGKQKRVRRPPMVEGLSVEEFILRNADPIWLHQEEMWEYVDRDQERQDDEARLDGAERDLYGMDVRQLLPESQLGRARWLANEMMSRVGQDICAMDILHALASIGLKLEPDANGLASLAYLDAQEVPAGSASCRLA